MTNDCDRSELMAGQTQDAKKLATTVEHDASRAREGDIDEIRPTGNWQLATDNSEDLALFRRAEAELTALQSEIRARAEQHGPYGRRLARLATAVEDARLQAREGVHEAHYGQYGQGQGA